MARPNNPTALANHIQGLREAKAAFQALPQITRDRLNAATETTASEIVRGAKARILSSPSVRTRALYSAIAYTMNKANGRAKAGVQTLTTTFLSAGVKVKIKGRYDQASDGSWNPTKIQPTRYAHLVEFGTKSMPAEPFMVPATEAEKLFYLQRCQAAGRLIEHDVAAVGARTL